MGIEEIVIPEIIVETEGDISDGATAAPEPEIGPTRDDRYFGRFGTFLATLPEETAESKEEYPGLYDRLFRALQNDSHVTAFAPSEFEPPFSREWLGFPANARSTTKQILSGSDHFHAFNFSNAIAFEVSVPAKNQPVIMGIDDVPTDQYWACWDGTTLLTIWRQSAESGYPARSAGHVVEAVLRRAAEAAGLGLLVQSCSPGCTNMYAHRTLRIDRYALSEGESPSLEFNGEHPRMIRAHLHADDKELDVVRGLHSRIAYACLHFAQYKNASRRLINTELLARRLTDELLTLDYSSLYGPQGGFTSRLRNRLVLVWRAITFRGRTRRAKRLVDSLWIAMARIESMQREWHDAQRVFNYYADLGDLQPFFDIDRKDDDDVANAVTTDFVRAAVEHRSARRDNRVIVWATLFGGLAGALAATGATLLNAGL